jgi:hypothetical protein
MKKKIKLTACRVTIPGIKDRDFTSCKRKPNTIIMFSSDTTIKTHPSSSTFPYSSGLQELLLHSSNAKDKKKPHQWNDSETLDTIFSPALCE